MQVVAVGQSLWQQSQPQGLDGSGLGFNGHDALAVKG